MAVVDFMADFSEDDGGAGLQLPRPFGHGRWGGLAEKANLAAHMRLCKQKRRTELSSSKANENDT